MQFWLLKVKSYRVRHLASEKRNISNIAIQKTKEINIEHDIINLSFSNWSFDIFYFRNISLYFPSLIIKHVPKITAKYCIVRHSKYGKTLQSNFKIIKGTEKYCKVLKGTAKYCKVQHCTYWKVPKRTKKDRKGPKVQNVLKAVYETIPLRYS